MDKKWKKFERVVAAIHVAENSGATVTWNDHINGRQFDVAIRFKFQFYDYLTLIECKDEQAHVEAEYVDAFVTKSRDAGANKAIIVSSSGFQSGAKKVAERHNIELFTLTEIQEMPEGTLTESIISFLVLLPVGFWKTGTHEIINLSKHPAQREYEINNIPMIGMGPLKLIDLLKPYAQLIAPFDIPGVPKFGGDFPDATQKRQKKVITLQLGTKIRFPGSSTEIPVSHLLLSYWMQDARLVGRVDPSTQYQYRNERTEETTTINAEDIRLGFDTKLEAGTFYYQPVPRFYYCESIEKNGALMFLIESYEHGQLVQAKAIVPFCDAGDFLELTDQKEIERLRPVLDQFRKMDEKYSDSPEAQAWRRDSLE
jgi:hypothetical protein